MEENNRKGPGVFYVVMGIATLVVAIIGATFAYFSAAATAEGDPIEGQTEDNLAGALSLDVQRVVFEGATANSDHLVPTDLTADKDGINAAVNKKCIGQGYTGCHIYRITASSTRTLQNASVKLTSLTTTAVDAASWKYAIYTNTGDTVVDGGDDGEDTTVANYAADSVVTTGDFKTFKETYMDVTPAGAFDMHNNAGLTENVPVYYYLVIYLANKDNAVQNPETSDEHDGTGTYNGTVSMDVLGGKVVASFSATA